MLIVCGHEREVQWSLRLNVLLVFWLLYVHNKFHHQDRDSSQQVGNKYWIMKAHSTRRFVVPGTIVRYFTKNRRAKPIVPEMGSPSCCRLKPHQRPFTLVGQQTGRGCDSWTRREKRWGALFTLATIERSTLKLPTTSLRIHDQAIRV
jgi:hypothetical protein